MFVLKAIRHATADLIAAAAIEIGVGGVPTPVTLLRNPPAGGWVNDDQLPAIYLYVRRETIAPQARGIDERAVTLDLMLQAKGSSSDVLDQLDDLQLAVERLIAASDRLGGVVADIRPQDAEVHIERGSVVFAARRVSFAARAGVTRRDPVLT